MAKKPQYLLVLSTCPESAVAEKIANELVQDRLAACVQIIPGVQSFFRWAGKVDNQDELLMFIKTTADKYGELEMKIKTLHPYELPEIIAVPISTGFSDYLSWIEDNT